MNKNVIMNKKYILSIEDNRSDIIFMKRVFEHDIKGYTMEFIEDGESAIKFFESKDFQDNPPKCIFLDIKLPKMNGLEVLNYLRNKKNIKDIPVIMLSSSDRQKEIEESYLLGGNSYIQKPKDYLTLKQTFPAIVNYWLNFNKAPIKAA